MGQIFTSKYNFVFNSDIKQIGFYKKVTQDKNNNINYINDNKTISIEIIIIIVIIGAALIFTVVGFFLGKKIFGWRRKTVAYELEDELDYEYKTKDDYNAK